jgi:hypothetical protein
MRLLNLDDPCVDVMSIEDIHHQLGGLEVLGAELVC